MSTIFTVIGAVAAVAVALWGLDRLLLAAEARGFIYYRRRKPNPGSVASALLAAHANLEPGRQHIVEHLREDAVDQDEAGAPPPDDERDSTSPEQ